ncbi:MAG: hypothetical protein FJZ96_08880 [Chloroflexi bacterium]|nr:hypothetical protein [Chloroflexota bacterium]
MRRAHLFWGSILILLSALFFLKATGVIDDVLGFLWPSLLILVGCWFIASPLIVRLSLDEIETFRIELQNASEARLNLDMGAGRAELRAGNTPGLAASGTKAPGMHFSSRLVGNNLDIDVDAGPTFIPFLGPTGGSWSFELNRDIPWNLDIDAGASKVILDLDDLLVAQAEINTGASAIELTLPSRGQNSRFDIEAGAATLDIHVPDGIAARFRIKEGVTALNLDESRFPRVEGGFYQTSDYPSAMGKIDVSIEAGAGTIKIR